MIAPRRPTLVGRDAEMAALRRAAVAARSGHGGLVLVHGEAGVGKSRLCRDFTASVEALHLRGQAYPGDEVVAHAVLVDTLRTARRDAASGLWAAARTRSAMLGAIVPELLEGAGATVQFDDDVRIFETVLDAVEEAAARRLVVWLVEDVQWADTASWLFLHYCSRRAPSMRLLVVATYRDDESLPADPAWTRLVTPGSREGVATVALQPLSTRDTARLVREVSGATLSDGDIDSVVQRSGGTPLLVEELVAAREGIGGLQQSVPDVVRVTARERARKAGDDARALLDLAAVMGRDADLFLLVDLRPDQATSVDALVGAGLLRPATEAPGGTVEFRHPLLRDAVYEDIPWERRRRLHAEAAAALTDHTSVQSVERIARHWELAGRPDEALACLVEVIEVARRQDNLHRSTSLGLLALALVERHDRLQPQRETLLRPLIEDLFHAGKWTPLLPLVREILHATPRDDPRRLRLVAILGQGEVQNLGTAVPELRRVIADELAIGDATPTADRALLLYTAAFMAWVELDLAHALELAREAERTALACGALDVELRVRVVRGWIDLTMRHDRDKVRDDTLDTAARARNARLAPREASALLQVARITLDAGDIGRAEAAGRAGLRWYEHGAALVRAGVAAFAGRTTDAVQIIDDIAPNEDAGAQAQWTALQARCLVMLMQGQPDLARATVVEMRAMSTAITSMHTDELAMSGWASWEKGDLAEAASLFAAALVGLKMSRLEPGFCGPYVIALHVDALIRTGRTDEADAVIAAESAHEDRPDSDRYTRASFAAARLRRRPTTELLEAARESCRRADWPWLEALCDSWAAELLGDPPAARHARARWAGLDNAPGVARIDQWMARNRTPGATDPSRPLTPREEEVADLIAEGLTNAMIADRLGISAVTVARHVSSLLDKLGVASRTQVAVLRARGDS